MPQSIGTLYTIDHQSAGKRIKAVAAYAGLKLDIAQNYTHGETNKTEPFLVKFASGKIPAFEDHEGFTLFESKAIARYVAELAPKAKLLGTTPKEAALVEQWVSFVDAEIAAPVGIALLLVRGTVVPYNKATDTFYRERGLKCLDTLEKHLSTRTFLVGERITLADITAASFLQAGYKFLLDAEHRKANPNILRFFNTIVNHPSMKECFGPTEFCEKAVQFTPPAKPAKEPKPAAPAVPKEEKKPKAKKQDDDEEEEDDILKEEPKAKNPLDSLPKSEFNLEDWKRTYSNLDTRGSGGSVEWFYEKFDKAGFSVWRVDFKYNDELTQVFMSSNQIGGFFNRLEGSRKYLFGSVGVLGTANNSVISGVFICRGPDIIPVVEVAPDYESYKYEKLDLHSAKDKQFFEAALAWDLEIDGKKWADGKAFK